jgi:Tol biopolymer transport system component
LRLAAVLCIGLLAVGCTSDDDTRPAAAEERIAFASSRDGDFEIYTIRPDGSDVRQLTDNEAEARAEMDDSRPVWSPDGRWIAFMSTADHQGDGAVDQEIYVMRADGSKQKRLTDNGLAELLSGWTADGRVVFWRCRDSVADCDLLVVGRDGGDERTIYETSDVLISSFGPERGEVHATFIKRTATSLEGGQTFVIDVESGKRRPVNERGLRSPDGRHLLIETDRDKNGPCLFHDCTGHAPELYADDLRLTHTTGYDTDAGWSPAGKRIVFARIANDDRDDYELWVMNADGSCETQITDNGDWDVGPDWYGPPDSDQQLDC